MLRKISVSRLSLIETNITSFGSFVFSIKLMKSVVSLRYNFCCWPKNFIYITGQFFFSVDPSVGGIFVSFKHTEEQLFFMLAICIKQLCFSENESSLSIL